MGDEQILCLDREEAGQPLDGGRGHAGRGQGLIAEIGAFLWSRPLPTNAWGGHPWL